MKEEEGQLSKAKRSQKFLNPKWKKKFDLAFTIKKTASSIFTQWSCCHDETDEHLGGRQYSLRLSSIKSTPDFNFFGKWSYYFASIAFCSSPKMSLIRSKQALFVFCYNGEKMPYNTSWLNLQDLILKFHVLLERPSHISHCAACLVNLKHGSDDLACNITPISLPLRHKIFIHQKHNQVWKIHCNNHVLIINETSCFRIFYYLPRYLNNITTIIVIFIL